ncbi:MAG: carbohydrate binding family 9 domain-containing protein [Acidobacteria bacterium]|nr:carbohydrate binding family 9 domain-containing protein [Acidobacteriota bacterium]MCA1642883.1 carbohydrate binding family 9 domain-containing protein [Acidobacteriota bacterium]
MKVLALTLCLFALHVCALAQTPAVSTPSPSPTAAAKQTDDAKEIAPEGKTDPGAKALAANSPAGGRTIRTSSGVITVPAEKLVPIRVPRFDKAPVIDGKLDDEVWKRAAVFKDFYQVQPGDNTPASKPSEAFIGYDSRFLYLAFHAYDDPTQVRARVAKRDGIFDDDFIGVYLDTYNDKRKAIEFFFNPLGVQADAVRTEGSGEDFSIDFVHESKGMLTSDGYVVEAAIPFKSLRYTAGKDKLWGFHVFRRIQRFNSELDSWLPLSREISGTLIQEGFITGLEGISNERNVELVPSLTVSETGRRARAFAPAALGAPPPLLDSRTLNAPIDFDPGLTVKFGITPTVTLDAAINPDFAQVEADATVVTANQRFPIFFEEKRPFFLEGKEVFQTPLTIVHTRAIVDPDLAVKLSGKRGRNTFGLIVASDNAPGNFSQDEIDERWLKVNRIADPDARRAAEADLRGGFLDKLVGKNATIGVLRLKRDVGRENTLGLIATTYSFPDRYNHVGGVDGRFKLDPKTVFSFQLLGTRSHRPFFEPELGANVDRTGNAFAYRWSYDRSERNYGINVNGDGYTRDYKADVGFTTRTNTNAVRINPRWNSEPNTKNQIISYRANASVVYQTDFQGRSQRVDVQPMFGFNLQRQTAVIFGYRRAYERLIEEEFGKKRSVAHPCDPAFEDINLPPDRRRPNCGFYGADPERSTYKHSVIGVVESQFSKKYFVFLQVIRDMNVFDFDFGNGRKFPRVSPAALLLGQGAPLDPGAGDLWNIQSSFVYQPSNALRTSLDYTKQRLVRDDTGRTAFDENIITSRTTYQFTRFLFARARADYSTLASRMRGQFLVGWTPNPGTAFYVGYNDDMTRSGFDPFSGSLQPGFRRNGRTFFIKMSYLIRRSFGG